MLDIICFRDTEGINQNGLITSTFTAVLTQPMFPILALQFYKSCKDMQNLCNQSQGLPQFSMFSYFISLVFERKKSIGGDVSDNVPVSNAQPGTIKLESIEVENTENSEIIEVVNSNETVTSYLDHNFLNEVQKEFANLTKAWSPMMLTLFACESIMLINAGFVLSKFILHEGSFGNLNDEKRVELPAMIYLLCQSVTIIMVICIVAEWTHNRVIDYSHAVR